MRGATEIREIKERQDLDASVDVIRESFMTVAREFGLTRENCPTNPAFIMRKHLDELRENGAALFGLFDGDRQVGFLAIQEEEPAVFCARRLAIVPEHRHGGLGKELMEFACEYARANDGEKVVVRIMDNNVRLKEWYERLGYAQTGTRHFEHLPFDVCSMEKRLAV
jgi:ribosomal protein S18 acetylase RimI-like enzyme